MLTITEQLLTTRQTCQTLNIGRATLYRWIAAGRITPIRLASRTIRYREADITLLITLAADDDAAIIRAAHTRLAETQAEESRLLCPDCGRRRVNRGQSICTYCTQAREAQLEHKRRWWNAHGQENRVAKRQQQEQAT